MATQQCIDTITNALASEIGLRLRDRGMDVQLEGDEIVLSTRVENGATIIRTITVTGLCDIIEAALGSPPWTIDEIIAAVDPDGSAGLKEAFDNWKVRGKL